MNFRARFFLILSLLILIFADMGYSQTPSTIIRSSERTFDFGQIEEKDGKVSHTFVFQNYGKSLIGIDNVATGCGCVTFEYSKEPIGPGESRNVTVTYNPAYRPGFFSKEIVVLSNNRQNYTRIWIKGDVAACEHPVEENYPYHFGGALWMNLKVVALGKMKRGVTKTMKLKYVNVSEKDIKLSFVVVGGNMDIKFTSPGLVKARGVGEMLITYQCTTKLLGLKETHVYAVVDSKVLEYPFTVTCTID